MTVKREPLDPRRECEAIDFECGGQKYTAHIGRYRDGRIAEIFLTATKVGTAVDTAARDASVAFSLAVQHGASPWTISKALTRNSNGAASGPLGEILDILQKDSVG